MTFWDHLDELRRVLFRVIGVWFVLAIGYFVAMPYLFDHVILAPCHNDFVFYDLLRFIGQKFDLTDEFFTQEFKVKLVNINLAAPFFYTYVDSFLDVGSDGYALYFLLRSGVLSIRPFIRMSGKESGKP